MRKVKVVQLDEQKPVPIQVIADSIVAISDGVKKLRSGPLNERALLLLIQHAAPTVGGRGRYTAIGVKEIKAVLDGMESLEETFLKKKSKS